MHSLHVLGHSVPDADDEVSDLAEEVCLKREEEQSAK